MNLDYTTLQCFIAVAETHSFTRASQRIARTQSAVSQQIAKLEQQLGTPLLIRSKPLQLNEQGEIFLSYAKRLCALQQEALARCTSTELRGEVRLGVPEDFASVFLTEVLMDFVHSHPRVSLHIACDLTLPLFAQFKRQLLDLVLVKMDQPDEVPNGQAVWTEPLVWVGRTTTMFAEDKDLPLVLAPKPCVYRARALACLQQANRSWRMVFSSRSHAGMSAAVAAGMGITVLPRNMVPSPLTPLRSEKLPALGDVHVSLLKHTPNNAAINSLEAFVLKQLGHAQPCLV